MTMPGFVRHAAVVAFALQLAGCGTSVPVRYFNLEPIDYGMTSSAEQRHIVGLGPLDLPGYLARPQIVTRGTNAEIIINDFRRWAEPVDESMHRIVAANVEGLVEDVTVVSYPYHTMAQPEFRIYGDVVRFDADVTGEAVLVVQWGIAAADRTVVAPPQRARYVAQASNPTDTGAVVIALNAVIAEFSRDIATHIEQAIRD